MSAAVAVQWLARSFAILRDLDREILEMRSVNEIAQTVLAHLRDLVSWDRASVVVFDQKAGQALFLNAGIHSAVDLAGAACLPLAEFREFDHFRAGITRVVEDVAALAKPGPIDRRLQTLGIRAYANVPLLARGELLGLLNVARQTPGPFAPEHLDLVRAVAGRLAVALWQNQLHEQEQQHAQNLAQQVATRTATLRQQRDFLNAIFDTAGALIVVLDQKGRVVRLNRTAEEVTGLTTVIARDRPVWELLPLEVDFTPALIDQLRVGRFPREFESILRTVSGERRLVEWTNTSLAGESGQVEHIVAIGLDTTEHRRAEEAYQQLVENSLQGQVILQEYRVIFANPAFTAITGYGLEFLYQMSPETLLSIVHPEERALFHRRLEERFRGEVLPPRFEFRFRHADGEWRWLESYTGAIECCGAPAIQATCIDITERKQVQVATQRLAAIVASSSDAIIGKTLDGEILSWNRGASRIYGYTAEEAIGRHVCFLAPAGRQEEAADLLRRLCAGEAIEQYETVRQRCDGRRIDVSLTLSPIHDEQGKVVGVATIARDVTSRKRAEAALRESEAFNQAVLDSLPIHVAVLNREGQIKAVNRAWKDFAAVNNGQYQACTGVETHDLQVCRCAVGKEKEMAHWVLAGVSAVVKGDSPRFSLEYPCFLASGERWFLLDVNPLRNGRQGAVVSHLDITERRRAESQIRYQANLIENVQDAVISTDIEWRVQSWNEAAERIYGWQAEEVLGRPVQEILHTHYQPGQRQQVIEQVITAGHWEGQVVQKRRDGSDLFIYTSMSLLSSLSGHSFGAVAVNRDVGERVRAQQEKEKLFQQVSRQRQHLHTLSIQLRRLTREVVHSQEEERHRLSRELHDEAGQALSLLRYTLELFRRDLLATPEIPLSWPEAEIRLTEALAICDRTLQQIRNIAHDLRPGSLEDLGLNMALEAYCHDFAERTRLHIDYQGIETPILPEALAISLYRFLQEALTNVLKHAQAGKVRVELSYEGRDLILLVEDDGQGFPEWQQTGRREEGEGIGLLGMRERLDAINGELVVTPRPGGGVRLVARVPCADLMTSVEFEETRHEADTRTAR